MLLCVLAYLGFGIAAVVAYVLVRGLLAHSLVLSGKGGLTLLLLWLAGALFVLIVSYVLGLLIAHFYNLFADWWGGVRFDLARPDAPQHAAPEQPTPAPSDSVKQSRKERRVHESAEKSAPPQTQSEGKEPS